MRAREVKDVGRCRWIHSLLGVYSVRDREHGLRTMVSMRSFHLLSGQKPISYYMRRILSDGGRSRISREAELPSEVSEWGSESMVVTLHSFV